MFTKTEVKAIRQAIESATPTQRKSLAKKLKAAVGDRVPQSILNSFLPKSVQKKLAEADKIVTKLDMDADVADDKAKQAEILMGKFDEQVEQIEKKLDEVGGGLDKGLEQLVKLLKSSKSAKAPVAKKRGPTKERGSKGGKSRRR